MKDSAIHYVAVGDRYYEQTPVGYLVKVTHRYGGPVNNDLDSDSDSPSEVPRSIVALTVANASKTILAKSLVILIGASLPSPPFHCFMKACPPSILTPRIFTASTPPIFAPWLPVMMPPRRR